MDKAYFPQPNYRQMRDIDKIITLLKQKIDDLFIEQLKVRFLLDDNGIWFITKRGHIGEIQLESSYGVCPFLIESDFNDERYDANSVDEAVKIVEKLSQLFVEYHDD